MTLQLLAPASAVYWGKLLFNLALVLSLNTVTVSLYALFVNGFVIRSAGMFVATLFLASAGLAVAATVIAAIIARANSKGTLYPVLSFPLLLPLLIAAVDATKMASEGAGFEEGYGVYQFLISYIVVVTIASYYLFDYIWKD